MAWAAKARDVPAGAAIYSQARRGSGLAAGGAPGGRV